MDGRRASRRLRIPRKYMYSAFVCVGVEGRRIPRAKPMSHAIRAPFGRGRMSASRGDASLVKILRMYAQVAHMSPKGDASLPRVSCRANLP